MRFFVVAVVLLFVLAIVRLNLPSEFEFPSGDEATLGNAVVMVMGESPVVEDIIVFKAASVRMGSDVVRYYAVPWSSGWHYLGHD